MDLRPAEDRQPLLFDFTLEDVQTLVDENSYLRGYLQGYLAEARLRQQLLKLPGVSNVTKIPDADLSKGDLLVMHRGTQISVECKSLSTGILREDVLNASWEASVLCKNTDRRTIHVEGLGNIQSVNLKKGGFDLLSICTYPVTGAWTFLFLENRFLPEPDDKPGFIKSRFTINTATTAGLTDDATKALDNILQQKQAFTC